MSTKRERRRIGEKKKKLRETQTPREKDRVLGRENLGNGDQGFQLDRNIKL